MASGRQAFFLVTRTSSDHLISLYPQTTQMLLMWAILLWWRLAINHHSVMLIFRRSLLLMLSKHQMSALCQAWTEAKSLCAAAKKIKGTPYKNFVETTQNIKIKQKTKSETKLLASNALLGPSKRRKRRVRRDPPPSDTPSDSDIELTVPLAND